MRGPHSAAEVALPSGDQLGEGPCWDGQRAELTRVDIAAGVLHRWSPTTGRTTARALGAPLAFALPTRRGGIVVGHRDAVLLHEPGEAARPLAVVEHDAVDNRFNDAACDPRGRLLAGTMSTTRRPGAAALYRVADGAGARPLVTGTTISNGLGWSPTGDLLYFVDSTTQRIDRFDYDVAEGTLSDRRPFAAVDPDDGLPDGLAVDGEGGVWLCLFGGGAVRRYAPDGQLDAVVELPVTNPTSCAFGGPDLRTLFVTSARHRLSAEQVALEPAGAVLALEPGVLGLPAVPFDPALP